MAQFRQITGENVIKLLNWNDTVRAVESAMLNVTRRRAIQNPRSVTEIPGTKNRLYSMPGYLNDENFGALACKLVTSFPNNSKESLPSTLANILLFCEETGALKAIIDATELTLWRTAAASAVATKYMRSSNKKNTLVIVGAGAQARIHAIAFQEIFKFNKVCIWNRNYEKAEKLCNELNNIASMEKSCVPFKLLEEYVDHANVIVTTTFSTIPLIKHEWLKRGVHINAVGACANMMELDENVYKSSVVFVDHMSGVEHELKHLTDMGIVFQNEVGALINGTVSRPGSDESTIFQNLGMAIEDCVMARMIYDKYLDLEENIN